MNVTGAKQLFAALCRRLHDPDLGLATPRQAVEAIRAELLEHPLFLRDDTVRSQSELIAAVVDGRALAWDAPENAHAVTSVRSALERVTPSSVASLVSILDELLRDLLVFKSSRPCPRCGDDDLRCFYEPQSGVVALNCDVCDWSEAEPGRPTPLGLPLIPASRTVLEERGLATPRG